MEFLRFLLFAIRWLSMGVFGLIGLFALDRFAATHDPLWLMSVVVSPVFCGAIWLVTTDFTKIDQ